tara:strand:+ start:23 stop:961 length:939 start_codon:yes stop_codon:yes gene_type:complete
MKIDKWLYFRNVADEDNDDGDTSSSGKNPSSICIPASAVKKLSPESDTTIAIGFDPVIVYQQSANGQRTNWDGNDFIVLNTKQGKTFEVMEALSAAINGSSRNDNGFITVADDVTTNTANETVAAKYLHPSITSCGSIGVSKTPQGKGMHEYYEQVAPAAVDDNDVAASLSVKLPAQAVILEAAIICTSVATNDVGSVALEIHNAAIADDAASGGTEIIGADTVNLSIQGVTNAAGTKDVDNTSVPDADLDISSNAVENDAVHSGVIDPIDRGTAETFLHVCAKEDMKSTAVTGSPRVGVYVKWWGAPAIVI